MEDVYLVLINANHYSHAKRTNIDALMEAAEAWNNYVLLLVLAHLIKTSDVM